MTANQIAACLFIYAVLVTVLLSVSIRAYNDLAAENRLRRRNEIAANTRLARAVEYPSASVFERRTR